jgi:carbonic anhydrase
LSYFAIVLDNIIICAKLYNQSSSLHRREKMSHNCASLLVTCMDFRIQGAVHKFMIDNGLRDDCDVVTIPGGQKMLADVITRDSTMKMVNLSVDLHGVTEVYLVAHDDCGAYGGTQKFRDRAAERKAYKADLEKAVANIKRKHPKLTVWVKLAVFDGERWRVVDFTEDTSIGVTAHGGPPDFSQGAKANRAEAPEVTPEPEEDEGVMVDTTDDHPSEIEVGPNPDEIILDYDDDAGVILVDADEVEVLDPIILDDEDVIIDEIESMILVDADEVEVAIEEDEFESEVLVEDETSTVTVDPYWQSNTSGRRRRL